MYTDIVVHIHVGIKEKKHSKTEKKSSKGTEGVEVSSLSITVTFAQPKRRWRRRPFISIP